MSEPISRDSAHENPSGASSPSQRQLRNAEQRSADAEMARVLHTEPVRMAFDPSGAAIAHWKHDPLHDVVEPMSDHVIMAYNGAVQRMERRSGRSIAKGTFRPGAVIIIPEGSSSRWDIPKPVDVVQLYLPTATLARVADEADTATAVDLLERTAHPDPVTSRLLLSAADVLEGNSGPGYAVQASADQTCSRRVCWLRIPASPTAFQPTIGGLSPKRPASRHRTLALGQRCRRLPCGARFGCRPVALPLLSRLQGKYRALTPCVAAAIPPRASDEHAARHRHIDCVGGGGAWLCLADGIRRRLQAVDRRNARAIGGGRAR